MVRALVIACLPCIALAHAAAGRDLAARLDAALAVPALRGARIAALVTPLGSDQALYARSPDRALVPASNLKILTAIAVLSAFGPTHRFETRLRSTHAPDAAGDVGTLFVEGAGDPLLTSEQWWRLAADLHARGVRRASGGLVIDDARFDRERWNPIWGETSSRAYHAPVGALSANYGAFEVRVISGDAPGQPLRISVDPPVDYLRVVNRGRTGAPGSRPGLQIDREPAGERDHVIVSGSLPSGAVEKRVARSVSDPGRYAASVLRMQLEALRIQVTGDTHFGRAPPAAHELHAFRGHTVAEAVRRFMKWSNNTIGETLLKGLAARAEGPPGSWAAGLPAAERELVALGLPLEGLVLRDGSGLAYQNRVSPRTLVAALRTGRGAFGFGPEFVTALPIAGEDGTLKDRTNGSVGRVRAKTGLLTRVTGLSGFALLADGREAIFSILVNGFRSDAGSAMEAVDGFVAALVASPAPGSEAAERRDSEAAEGRDAERGEHAQVVHHRVAGARDDGE